MNVWKFIKKTVLNACFYFTIAEFAMLIFATVFLETDSTAITTVKFLNLASTSLVFLACLILSVFNFVWRLDYSAPLKTLIHFFGLLAAYALIFIVIPRTFDNVTLMITLIAVYTVFYFVIGLIVLIINSIRKTRRSDKLEYKPQFDDLNKK